MKNIVPGGKNMANLYIDGVKYEAQEGKNLLEVCLSLGFDIPYFCWHPALNSVGACRQCAIKQFKDENDEKGKIVMSCMTPLSDNMIISINDPEVEEFRKSVIEWLMVNHPHDCPVCDEGGECHLQDMTVMTGHNYRRFRFNKRTYTNQYLGPFINHEMNRCIQCYRCVRFYRDYAGGHDFDVFGAHDHVYFGRHKDGRLENEFSGNLVEICPTGVFTDKTLKNHYTRKWDLTQAPSVCSQCSLGCNIIAGERYGSLRRIQSRFNSEVNGYFICDRGRFGYEYVNSEKRIRHVELKKDNAKNNSESEESIIRTIGSKIKAKPIGIGSPRASVESNFMLKQLVGGENFYAGENKLQFSLSRKILNILSVGNVRTPSLKEIENADAVLILGEDITNTAPMMALAVRQAALKKPRKKAEALKIPAWHEKAVRTLIQDEKGPVYTATSYPTKLTDISSGILTDRPDKLAEFGFTLANILDNKAPEGNASKEQKELAEKIAAELKNAENPLIISGTGCLNESVIEAAYNISRALKKSNDNTSLSYVLPENNSMGMAMFSEKNIDDLINEGKSAETLIILENDLYRRMEKPVADDLLAKFENIIVLDHLENKTTGKADIIIPAGTFAESQGAYVNNEGRVQRFFEVYEPSKTIKGSWEWLYMLKKAMNGDVVDHVKYDEVISRISESEIHFKGMNEKFLSSGFRMSGQKIARQPHRYSGRTAMHANEDVNEPEPSEDKHSPFSFTMEGYQGQPPSSLIPFFWSPGWNSVQSVNKYQVEVGGPLHGGDPGFRLIEPNKEALDYFKTAKKPEDVPKDKFYAVASYHIFGSEELSSYSPVVGEVSSGPYAGISEEDSDSLDLGENDSVKIKQDDNVYQLPVKIISGLPPAVLIIAAGLKDFYFDFSKPLVKVNKNEK